MAKKTSNKTEKQLSSVLQQWVQRISLAEANQSTFFKKAADWYDLLHARVQDDDFQWHSRYFDPVIPAKIWNIVAKVVAGGSGWSTSPVGAGLNDEEMKDRAKAIAEALKFYENNAELDEPMRVKYAIALLDAAVAGVGYMKVPWTIKAKAAYERIIDDQGNIDAENYKVTKFTLSYPDAQNLSIGDVLYSPAAKNTIQSSPWLIVRSWMPFQELEKANAARGGKFYKNLEKVRGKQADYDELTKARNRLLQQDMDSTVDMVEVHECYEKAFEDGAECVYVTTVANRGTIIRERTKSIFWHGKYPVVEFKIKPRAFSPTGEGIMETNERGVWAINDITNHYLDAWNLANNPMILQEENTVVDSYEVAPGNQILYRGSSQPQPFTFPMPSVQAYDGIYQRLLSSLEANSISGYQTGTPNDATDNTSGTLGGIRSIQQAGDDLLNFYREVFREGVKQLGQMWMQNIQQFLDKSIWVEITGNDGPVPFEITPQMLQGDFLIELDENSLQAFDKEQDRQAFLAYMRELQTVQTHAMSMGEQVPIVWTEVIKDASEKFGIKDADKYIGEQPLFDPMQQGMGMEDEMGFDPMASGMMDNQMFMTPPPPPPMEFAGAGVNVPPPPPPLN